MKYKLKVDRSGLIVDYYFFNLYVEKKFLGIPYWSYVTRRTSIIHNSWDIPSIVESYENELASKRVAREKNKRYPIITVQEI